MINVNGIGFRLNAVNFKEWRQSYKALVLLDFLITHGPETIAEEFVSDTHVIRQLGTFRHVDQHGFDWGSNMQKRSERIIKLQTNQNFLNEERQNALKLSRDINQGFGNSFSRQPSPLTSSSPSAYSPVSNTSRSSSFSSNTSDNSDTSSSINKKLDQPIQFDVLVQPPLCRFRRIGADDSRDISSSHMWKDNGEDNTGSSLLDDEEEGEDRHHQKVNNTNTTVAGKVSLSLRTISEVGKLMFKTFDRRPPVGFWIFYSDFKKSILFFSRSSLFNVRPEAGGISHGP